MTEPAAPAAPAAPPAAAAPAAPAAAAPPSPAPSRPDWLPEAHWDGEKGSIKLDDFGKHYSEVATTAKAFTEKQAALAARKPEDIKIEFKLPDGVKVPDGMELKFDDKDPHVAMLRSVAAARGLDQDAVNDIVSLRAQMLIAEHNAEQVRVAEANKALGEKARDRKSAVANWFKGMKDRGDISAEEFAEATELATFPTTITLFEKLMAKAAGSVPGSGAGAPPAPPKPADVPIEQRWYGNSQKAS